MFAVMVKPAARKRICTGGLVWVKDDHHEFYVGMKERGLWPTKEEAEKMITEPWEIAVEVHNKKGKRFIRFTRSYSIINLYEGGNINEQIRPKPELPTVSTSKSNHRQPSSRIQSVGRTV